MRIKAERTKNSRVYIDPRVSFMSSPRLDTACFLPTGRASAC